MSRKYQVTVLVLTYNQESILGRALHSIIHQKVTLANFKIIVIDDASTDGTKEVIEGFKNQFPDLVKSKYYLSNQYQMGGAPEFPVMEELDTDFIAFCDGDDFWPDQYKLEKQLEEFHRIKSLAIVHTDYFLGKAEQEEVSFIRRTQKDRNKAMNVRSSFDLVYGNEIKKSTAMYRKKSIDFDFLRKSKGIRAQDWLVSVSAGTNGGVYYIDEPTTVYRLSDGASFQSLTQQEKLEIKDEVREFCSIYHPDKKLRKHFRRYLLKETLRKKIRDNYVYRPIRPLVIICRNLIRNVKVSFW